MRFQAGGSIWRNMKSCWPATHPCAGWVFSDWIGAIVVRRGALWLARKTAAQVIPVAFRYEWLVESRPSILVNCGEPMAAGARVDDLARTMQALYDDIAKSLKPVDLSGYTPVYRPRMSMNKSWELFTRSPNDREFNPSNE